MTRVTETARYVALLRAAVERARDLLDESEDSPQAVALADALDDLDAYCERCDDRGVVVRRYDGEPWGDVFPVVEVPCDCEAARVLAEQRVAR